MKQKDLLFLLVSSAMLACVWIVFTILHNTLTSTISSTVNEQIQSINSSFDGKTLSALQSRKQVTPVYSIQGTDNITPTPTPTLAPVALISPIESGTSTNSGQQFLVTPTPTVADTPTPTP